MNYTPFYPELADKPLTLWAMLTPDVEVAVSQLVQAKGIIDVKRFLDGLIAGHEAIEAKTEALKAKIELEEARQTIIQLKDRLHESWEPEK